MNPQVIADAAVDAVFQNLPGWVAGYLDPETMRAALEAAAPHMLASMAMQDSDLILSIVDAAGIEAADQFDALVAVQKLEASDPYILAEASAVAWDKGYNAAVERELTSTPAAKAAYTNPYRPAT